MNNSGLRVTTTAVTSTTKGTMEHFQKIMFSAINIAPLAAKNNIFKGDFDVSHIKKYIRISLPLCQM
jgi:hypothetical protein